MSNVLVLPVRGLDAKRMRRLADELRRAQETGTDSGLGLAHIHAMATTLQDLVRDLSVTVDKAVADPDMAKHFGSDVEAALREFIASAAQLAEVSADFPDLSQLPVTDGSGIASRTDQ
ncbi:hypothetical protein [Methylobacterium komagatae]